MEGQGKRLLMAVGLALAVMLAWNMLFPQKPPVKKPVATAASGSGSGSGAAAGSAGAAGAPGSRLPPCVGATEELAFTGFVAKFSECGASLTGWHLNEKKLAGDGTKGDLLPTEADAGAFLVSFPGSTADVAHNEKWTFVSKSPAMQPTTIVYERSTPYFKLVKTFTVVPDSFVVRMNLAITALKPLPIETLAVSVFAYQDPKADLKGGSRVQARAWSSSTLRAGGDATIETTLPDLKVSPRHETSVQWTGFEQPYLLTAYAPKRDGKTVQKLSWALGAPWPDGLMRTDLIFPTEKIDVGVTVQHEVAGYLGLKNYKTMQLAEAAAGFAPGFTKTVDFGWFGIIGRPLLWVLQALYNVVKNWGVAIMLLTLLVKLVTLYPITMSTRSMKAMAALGPQMKLLQEKYKDDKQRQQVETMALYKQHGVSPIAGCLPMFLQMPVWIALYRMLSNAGELYHAPFIHGWINDLTAPDPTHVLPVVVLITMFAQARLQPQTAQGGQQKMIQYGMPLMFGAMSFVFPAGLALYIFTNTILSAAHSLYMNKFDKKSKEIAARIAGSPTGIAAAAATAAAGGTKAGKPVIDTTAVEVKSGASDSSTDDDSRQKRGPNAGNGAKKRRR